MRLSSVVLLSLAVVIASSSGCKVRGKRGLSVTRTASRNVVRRGECDCYTCQMKRQTTNQYVIDPVYEPVNVAPAVQQGQEQTIVAPVIDATMGQSDMENTVSDSSRTEPAFTPEPQTIEQPIEQEIQGQLIEDEELTNSLPPEPAVEVQNQPITETPATESLKPDPKPAQDTAPQLISPESSFKLKTNRQRSIAFVPSEPVSAQAPSLFIEKAGPAVDEGVFKIRPLGKLSVKRESVYETTPEVEKPTTRRGHSIWFAPTQTSTHESTRTQPSARMQPSTRSRPERVDPTPTLTQPAQQVAAPVIEPIIEHDVHEVAAPVVPKSIVLKARPVQNHLIYNSRKPTHAPVREARLTEHARYAMSNRQPSPAPVFFQPLPAEAQRWNSVTPQPMTSVPPVAANSNSQFMRPLPAHENGSAELTLNANPIQPDGESSHSQTTTAPMARVITSNSPVLKLSAVPAGAEPEKLPAVASIQQRDRDHVVVGSLQTPQNVTHAAQSTDYRVDQRNRLHTSPWQPMNTDDGGFHEVQQSIRHLMIQPQQEANFATDGIHR